MKRIAVLSGAFLVATPLYAVGFWAEGGVSASRISHKKWRIDMEADAWNGVTFGTELNMEGGGTLYGGDISAGVSFGNFPLLIGVGLDYSAGSGKTVFKDTSDIVADTISRWDATMLTFRLPVSYRLNLGSSVILAGFYPVYTLFNLKDSLGDSTMKFTGTGGGMFLRGYYRMGPVGVGGGFFLDYVPGLTYREEGYDPDLGNYRTTWTIKDNVRVGVRIGVFYATGM